MGSVVSLITETIRKHFLILGGLIAYTIIALKTPLLKNFGIKSPGLEVSTTIVVIAGIAYITYDVATTNQDEEEFISSTQS